MKSITLIGYMCVGKTTVGKALAKSLGCTFYDLDWYIEERFHSKVSQIFAEKGEEKFRDLEQRMLHEVAEFENIVLSCGGGTPCFFDNMDYLNSVSETFYLKASPETLCRHIAMSRGDRPLLKANRPKKSVHLSNSSCRRVSPSMKRPNTWWTSMCSTPSRKSMTLPKSSATHSIFSNVERISLKIAERQVSK